MSVLVVTSLGNLEIDLYIDECPLTCENFLKLCKRKYYNGCLFHTIKKDFIAQTGDPTGTGSGGDSAYKYNSSPPSPLAFTNTRTPNSSSSKPQPIHICEAGYVLSDIEFVKKTQSGVYSVVEEEGARQGWGMGEANQGEAKMLGVGGAAMGDEGWFGMEEATPRRTKICTLSFLALEMLHRLK